MLVLGHLGIGKALVNPIARKLQRRWLYLGTLLPDLIDKPLYYTLSWATGKHGLELGLISGTRTFAHTAIFAIAITVAALLKKSKVLAALSLGIATHLLLDSLADHLWDAGGVSSDISLFWPLKGIQMPIAQFTNILDHVKNKQPTYLLAELLGAALLMNDYYQRSSKRRSQRSQN